MKQINDTHTARGWIFALVAGMLLALGTPARAINYTWTNTVSDASGYWTNGVLWGNILETTYPGSAAGDSAFLTNQFSGTYTNILDFSFGRTVTTLSILNALGEAWLVVTNAVLTNTTFALNSGGRLRIDTGGVVTNTTAAGFTWLGANSVIELNTGGQFRLTPGAKTFAASGGFTGLVTSTSAPGNGGVMNFGGGGMLTFGGGNNAVLSITGGAVVTNVGNTAGFGLFLAGNGNSLIVTNGGQLYGTGGIAFGNAQHSNTIRMEGGTWNLNGNFLQIGAALSGGGANNSSNNSLHILGDAIVTGAGSFSVGGRLGALSSANNFNSLIATNGGRFIMTSGGQILVGATASSALGGNHNTVILSNSVLLGGTLASIGNGSTNNSMTLLADTVWNNNNVVLHVGGDNTVGGVSNRLIVSGALLTNFNTVSVGNLANARANQLVIENGGILSNFGLSTLGGLVVGAATGASDNSVIVTNGGQLFMSRGRIAVGAGNSSGPVVGGGNNTLLLSNSFIAADGNSFIGVGSSNNTVTLLAGTVWNQGNLILTIGSNAATGNVLNLTGAILTNISTFTLGNDAGASQNSVRVGDGGILSATTVLIGSAAGANDNSLLLTNRSILSANSLTIGASTTGNTISNRNAIYEFTAVPTITSVTPGDISLTDGTLSFRATGVANVATNYRIAFAGENTFRLNNASNTAATVSQTYTFDTVSSNPTNYVNLVMVNGATAYRNANGADITIGTAGTFLASNTVATISGNFTNNGTAAIVDATVNFQSALDVAGTLTLQNGFAIGAGAKTVAGTLRGNGSVVGDTTVSGILSPGFSVGTLVFSNNLTLAGSYQAEFGDAGNDQLIVVGDLTLAGATLDLTAVGGVTGAAYVIASYGDLFGTFSVTNGMPVGYMVDYNYNGAKQIAIVVIPEPGTLGLVGLGLVALVVVSRWRRR